MKNTFQLNQNLFKFNKKDRKILQRALLCRLRTSFIYWVSPREKCNRKHTIKRIIERQKKNFTAKEKVLLIEEIKKFG